MKTSICLGFILLLATPLHAETYSWVDDSGTYNYTENYSSVPKKYRMKVKRREDLPRDVKPQEPSVLENLSKKAEKVDAKPAALPGDEKDLYGGKTRAAWRREIEAMEAELNGIEQRILLLTKQIHDPKGMTTANFDRLKKEMDDSRATYDQKYKGYTELIETIRKAGIKVEMQK